MRADLATQRWLNASREAWNDRAEFFDSMATTNAQGQDRITEMDVVFAALGLKPGSRVLDAGCGAGQFSIAFAERGCSVDGVDLSPEMIERALVHATEADVTIQFSIGELSALDAPDGAYDAIVSRMALQFSPHVSAVLDEFERVAATAASMWLAVPGALSPIYRHSWQRFLPAEPEPMNYLVPWELVRLLSERGWQATEQWGSFDAIGPDASNAASDLDVTTLPLPLQQAAATVWNMIVSPAE